jgi:hypothetical protein
VGEFFADSGRMSVTALPVEQFVESAQNAVISHEHVGENRGYWNSGFHQPCHTAVNSGERRLGLSLVKELQHDRFPGRQLEAEHRTDALRSKGCTHQGPTQAHPCEALHQSNYLFDGTTSDKCGEIIPPYPSE